MPNTTITTEDDVKNFINVFTVEPPHQQEVIDVLVEAPAVIPKMERFIAANLRRGRDGHRVVNCVATAQS